MKTSFESQCVISTVSHKDNVRIPTELQIKIDRRQAYNTAGLTKRKYVHLTVEHEILSSPWKIEKMLGGLTMKRLEGFRWKMQAAACSGWMAIDEYNAT